MKPAIDAFLNHLTVERGLSANTLFAYRNDLNQFLDFLQDDPNHHEPITGWPQVNREVIARYGDATDPELVVPVAGALVDKGVVLGGLGRLEEALAAYEEVIARYGDATDPDLVVPVAGALLNKGVVLGGLGRLEEALAAFEEVIARYGDATDPQLAGIVAAAKDIRDVLVEP